MANLAAADVTVVVDKQTKAENGDKVNYLTLTFGNGVKTYAAGGVPLTGSQLGCPNVVRSVEVLEDAASSYSWLYDSTNKKLIAKYTPVAGNEAQPSTVAIAAQTLKVKVTGW